MKNRIITLSIVLITFFQVHAQVQNDTLAFNKNRFELNGRIILFNQVTNLMKDNVEALSAIQKVKSNNAATAIFSYAGGFLIGYPFGQVIGGGKPQWKIAGIGVGLVLISIPFSVAARNNARLAVRIYNEKVMQTGSGGAKIDFGLTDTGLRVRYSF